MADGVTHETTTFRSEVYRDESRKPVEMPLRLADVKRLIGGANTLKYFTETTFNYPTMAEAYRVAALNGLNRVA